MSTFFRPYEGARPFLFISYAHLQSAAVVDTIRILHEKGYRLWYDEGIPAGSDWPSNIAQHMQACDRVVFFLSERALESPNCFSEIRTAVRLRKPVLIVRLEERIPDERWRELLAGREEIPTLESPEERAEAILHSGFLSRRFHHSWTERIPWHVAGFAASLLFFLAAAAALGALASGRWSPLPPAPSVTSHFEESTSTVPPAVVDLGEAERYFAVSFPDRLQEKGIRSALGISTGDIYRGQLAEIARLHFCGSLVTGSLKGVIFDAGGTCRVNGAPVISGPISNLALLQYCVRLESLALVCQPLGDLSALNGHTLLRELSLAGSTVESLTALQDLPSLETLHLEHTAVHDLTPLSSLPNLKTVTVSRDMLPIVWDENAAFSVILAPES